METTTNTRKQESGKVFTMKKGSRHYRHLPRYMGTVCHHISFCRL